jgi:hypothetical protein
MSDFILSMNEISKSYQTSGPEKLTVLSSIDLQIAAGDLLDFPLHLAQESLLFFIFVVCLIPVIRGKLPF